MNTESIDDLLTRDIDDLTEIAGQLDSATRTELLCDAATALSRSSLPLRLKLIRFVQALAASDDASVDAHATDRAARALVAAVHGDDPTDRLAALRALAVIVANAPKLSDSMAHSVLTALEEARDDSSSEVRDLADELASDGNYIFERLIASRKNQSVGQSSAALLEHKPKPR